MKNLFKMFLKKYVPCYRQHPVYQSEQLVAEKLCALDCRQYDGKLTRVAIEINFKKGDIHIINDRFNF